jgi:hypothetical protein
MISFYRRGYYNQRISPEKLAYIQKRQKIVDLENRISYLKNKFGDSFVKPKLEDFQLNTKLIAEIEETNEKVRKENKLTDILVGIIGWAAFILLFVIFFTIGPLAGVITLFFIFIIFGSFDSFDSFFTSPKLHDSTVKYHTYLNLLKEYPSEEEIQKIKEEEKLLKENKLKIEYWFSLNGHDFETQVSKLFLKSGQFSGVVKTKGSGDGGIDLILTGHDGAKILVQCKAHKKEVGPHVARDLFGAMHSAGINKGIIISLGGVTQGVIDFIRGKDISVIDVNGIIEMQKGLSLEQ